MTYIKNYKKQKPPKNIQITHRYINEDNILAVPFDKGIGICQMDQQTYISKLVAIISLQQFKKETQKMEKQETFLSKRRKRIVRMLKKLKEESKIDKLLYEKLKLVGNQPT